MGLVWRATAWVIAVAGLGACEFGKAVIPAPAPRIVVHAVLNAGAAEQVLLVESSLTGRVVINDSLKFDPLDPIRTAGGEPISGADVRLLTGTDSVGVAATETRVNGRGTGRYVVSRAQLAVAPGATYRLRIRTTDGRVVTGRTVVPGAPGGWSADAALTKQPLAFNRDQDSLRLRWSGAAGARTYAVRVETPYGPWALFSDSTSFTLSGGLRNFLAAGLPNVFLPGFAQQLSVTAVDQNFYDYNRSGNDPFGGTGLISSVTGGLGLFGSLVVIGTYDVATTRTDRAPIDARWTGTAANGAVIDLDLWVDDPGPTASALSGRQRTPRRYLLGIQSGETVRLATLVGGSSADTLAFFTGRLAGDSLVGSYDRRFDTSGPTRFRRAAR
jgi:hypothetical protein